ncbi:MAG: hypothetical protein ABJA02_12665 [Acidobacteriota bacterium]
MHLRRSVPRDRGNLIDDGNFAAEGYPQLERTIAELVKKIVIPSKLANRTADPIKVPTN